MQDRAIVAAIVAGDPAGLAAAYDRYAPALHAYCRSLLAEPADAADAVQDTYLVAASKLAGLREPDRLRPWLYAVARNECHRRLRARARTADLGEAGEMTDTSADVGGAAERGELRDLVQAAIAGLNPGEREVIELSLRHELDGADLAGALGVPVNQAHALASRARGQLERSLGALLVAKSGRESCPELSALLAGWDGRLTVLLRKRVSRHIEHCDVCGERKRRELSPAMLLSALPVIMLPAGLRQQVLRLVSDVTPDAIRYREFVSRRAEPFGPSGFPVPVRPLARPRRPRGRTVVYSAAAALILIAGTGVAAAAMLRHDGGQASAAAHSAVTTAPAVTSAPPSGPGGSPSPVSSLPASSAPAPSAAAGPSRTAGPSPAPAPARTVRSSPSPSVSPGTLAASPAAITLTQPALGGPYGGTFTLTAEGGPVSFAVTVPEAAQAGLSVTPLSGSLTAGQSVTVTVTVVGNGPPTFTTVLSMSPGGATVTVRYPPRG